MLFVLTGHDMKRALKSTGLVKSSTGIAGLDDMTGGGLPHGRTTLLVGGPGSGKTILALQFLVHGARNCNEPGIFVAFEETPDRIVTNAEGFGWDLASLQPDKLSFVAAQPPPDLIQSGGFDLGGLLAALSARLADTKAQRIVFDALDIMLSLLPDAGARRREVYRLHHWLNEHKLTGLMTLKAGGDDAETSAGSPFGFMQFMVDCALLLSQNVVMGVSQRNLRVQKYRGSSFDENESPFIIGQYGFDVAVARTMGHVDIKASYERVSSGVERLDTMLGGGYYRGASILITGVPGTAKTTLAGAFAEAACKRGEPTVFMSFDSDGSEIIRNLSSVGIMLAQYVKSGVLRMVSARTITGSAETYLVHIRSIADDHQARCLVIDPVSTLSKNGNELTANSVAERLIDWSKTSGMTLLCTSLLDELSSAGSPMQISTLADTWIHLNYLVQAGERNRGLAIIKSRGTAHSNQVRELILSDAGVTLTDTYSAGGEVLMGTLRWEKESAELRATEAREASEKLRRVLLDSQEAELNMRVKAAQVELLAKQVEKSLQDRTTESRKDDLKEGRTRMGELRGSDTAIEEKA
jgi:circadian clock protein KaiC